MQTTQQKYHSTIFFSTFCEKNPSFKTKSIQTTCFEKIEKLQLKIFFPYKSTDFDYFSYFNVSSSLWCGGGGTDVYYKYNEMK